jgi:hypothetical protein
MADEAKLGDGMRAEPRLPMVESPKLDGSEAIAPPVGETAGGQADAASGEAAAAQSLSRALRFALLAASVAAAAALGSFVGSLSAAGVTQLWPAAEPSANTVAVSATQAMAAAKAEAKVDAKAELAELSALKVSLDGATRAASGQFAKVTDRLDRAERVQIESATKLAHLADAMDGLEKKLATSLAAAAAPQTTGSIGNGMPAASPTPAEAKLADNILADWIVQDVRGGHALVENRYGGVFNVAAGGLLPGLGRVETIKRQDGQWIVVTAHGLITEHN